jgi:hypothetical protein
MFVVTSLTLRYFDQLLATRNGNIPYGANSMEKLKIER